MCTCLFVFVSLRLANRAMVLLHTRSDDWIDPQWRVNHQLSWDQLTDLKEIGNVCIALEIYCSGTSLCCIVMSPLLHCAVLF